MSYVQFHIPFQIIPATADKPSAFPIFRLLWLNSVDDVSPGLIELFSERVSLLQHSVTPHVTFTRKTQSLPRSVRCRPSSMTDFTAVIASIGGLSGEMNRLVVMSVRKMGPCESTTALTIDVEINLYGIFL